MSEPTIETVNIEAMTFAVRELLSPEMAAFNNLRSDQMTDYLTGRIVTTFKVELAGKNEKVDVYSTQRAPASWWDHFKYRWFPSWALDRWPVEYEVFNETVHHHHVCPHIQMDGPHKHIQFLVDGPDKVQL